MYTVLFTFAMVLGIVLLFRATRGPAARAYDLSILWPQIKGRTDSLHKARVVFLIHMRLDPVWRKQCDEWSEKQFNDWVEMHLQ